MSTTWNVQYLKLSRHYKNSLLITSFTEWHRQHLHLKNDPSCDDALLKASKGREKWKSAVDAIYQHRRLMSAQGTDIQEL